MEADVPDEDLDQDEFELAHQQRMADAVAGVIKARHEASTQPHEDADDV